MYVPRIRSVMPLPNWKLHVTFENHVQKIYDCIPLFELERFRLLKNEAFFKLLQVDAGGYGISWNDDLDLSEYELWHNGIEIEVASVALDVVDAFV